MAPSIWVSSGVARDDVCPDKNSISGSTGGARRSRGGARARAGVTGGRLPRRSNHALVIRLMRGGRLTGRKVGLRRWERLQRVAGW